MFFSTSLEISRMSSQGEYLDSQIFSTGTVLSNAQSIAISTPFTGILQNVASFRATLNAFFPDDHFKFLFGSNASQDTTKIVIQKSDLPDLSPLVNNTAESLLVGILSKILAGNTVVNFPGLSFIYWGYGYSDNKRTDTILIETRNRLTLINTSEIPEISTIINPNNY